MLENLQRFVVFTITTSSLGWDTGRAITNALAILALGPGRARHPAPRLPPRLLRCRRHLRPHPMRPGVCLGTEPASSVPRQYPGRWEHPPRAGGHVGAVNRLGMPAASATVLGMSLDVELEVGRQDADVRRAAAARASGVVRHRGGDAVLHRDARTFPTVLARLDGAVVGALLWKRHYPESAEVHLMAVDPRTTAPGSAPSSFERAEDALRPTESATSRSRPWALSCRTTSTSGPGGSTRPAGSCRWRSC